MVYWYYSKKRKWNINLKNLGKEDKTTNLRQIGYMFTTKVNLSNDIYWVFMVEQIQTNNIYLKFIQKNQTQFWKKIFNSTLSFIFCNCVTITNRRIKHIKIVAANFVMINFSN